MMIEGSGSIPGTLVFLFPPSSVVVVGSGIRDPRSGIRNKHPGSATLPDLGFLLNRNPDPDPTGGFQFENFLPQNATHFIHGGLPRTKRRLQPSRDYIQKFKTENYFFSSVLNITLPA
jgi:hypothetical protein